MLRGDVPTFGPSLRTPDRQLNDLARDVGELKGLRAAPPLRLDWIAGSPTISLPQGEAGASGYDPVTHRQYVLNGTFATPRPVWRFDLDAAGTYLLFGNVAFTMELPAPGFLANYWAVGVSHQITQGIAAPLPSWTSFTFQSIVAGQLVTSAGPPTPSNWSHSLALPVRVLTAPFTLEVLFGFVSGAGHDPTKVGIRSAEPTGLSNLPYSLRLA